MITREQVAEVRKSDKKVSARAEEETANLLAIKYNLTPQRVMEMYRSQFEFLKMKMRDGLHENVRISHLGMFYTNQLYTDWCIQQDHELRERLDRENPNWMLKIKGI